MTPPFSVVHLDNHLLVIVKPAGLLAQADHTGDADVVTLGKAFLKAEFDKPGNVFLGLVHRLDRPVSGLMVLARTSKAAARLSAQFRARTVEKRYVALVEGRVDAPQTLRDTLRKARGRVEVVAPGAEGGRHAELRVTPLYHAHGKTLVDVDLGTGRAHQIRVQLASRGWPLVGDTRYGAQPGFGRGRIALHAYRLHVDHPTQPQRMTWQAAPEGWPAPFADRISYPG